MSLKLLISLFTQLRCDCRPLSNSNEMENEFEHCYVKNGVFTADPEVNTVDSSY